MTARWVAVAGGVVWLGLLGWYWALCRLAARADSEALKRFRETDGNRDARGLRLLP